MPFPVLKMFVITILGPLVARSQVKTIPEDFIVAPSPVIVPEHAEVNPITFVGSVMIILLDE
jgi:hypothetical protein